MQVFFLTLLLAPNALAQTTLQEDSLKKFIEYNQRACPWSLFQQGKDWSFFAKDNDNPADCAAACLATAGCTGFEVGPQTSHNFNDIMYCALWHNGNCNDVSKMLHLGGYKAKTYVLPSALPTTTASVTTTATTTSVNKADELFKDINKAAEIVKGIDNTAQKFVSVFDTHKNEKLFEQAAQKQPLLLFTALAQRACPWSQYTKGKDWLFASKESDDMEKCARACVAAKGCTGFEVGPHTSNAYNHISYCALWFHGKCGDEKNMLHLDPSYVATTFVMVKTVMLDAVAREKTAFVDIQVESKVVYQPIVSKEHYQLPQQTPPKPQIVVSTQASPMPKEHTSIPSENEPKQNLELPGATTDSKSAVTDFYEYPQLACEFDQYKEGQDWKYATATSSNNVEACASTCLNTDDCTGFELGFESGRGNYCALWMSGSCSTEKAMTPIPTDYQTVSTFVLSHYQQKSHILLGGFAIVFLFLCAAALIISILLVACICYKVCRRGCRRSLLPSVVSNELVQASVIRGTPVGQRVDVVVVLGEAVDQK